MKRLSTTTTRNITLRAPLGASVAVATRWASTGGGSDKATFFGFLDNMFTFDAAPVEAASTMSYGASMLTSLQHFSGLEGGLVLLAGGALTRLATMYASIYGERASWRMMQALPELKPAYDGFQHTYNSDRGNASEVQIGAAHLSAQKKEIFRKYNTSNLKTVAGLVASPLVILGLRGASQMCDPFNAAGFATSEVLWMTVSAVDPTFILPATVSALTLLNFELTLRNREDVTVGWTKNVVMCARGGAVIGFGLASQMSSGVLLYWLGMSLVGILQPLMVRSPAFRSMAGFPEIGKLAKPLPSKTVVPGFSAVEDKKDSEPQDNYRMRFGINHPFLNKLFNPDTEEHLELITRSTARPAQQTPTSSTSSPTLKSKPKATVAASTVQEILASKKHAAADLSTPRERSSVPMTHHPNLSKITRPAKSKKTELPSQHERTAAISSFDELAGDFRYDMEDERPAPSVTTVQDTPTPQPNAQGADAGSSWRATNRKL